MSISAIQNLKGSYSSTKTDLLIVSQNRRKEEGKETVLLYCLIEDIDVKILRVPNF